MINKYRETEYFCTPYGKVYSKQSGNLKEVKPLLNKDGYEYIFIYEKGRKRRKESVHRIVWESWVGKIGDNLTIDHADFNRTNNNIGNLSVMTFSENSKKKKESLSGLRSSVCKIDENDLILLFQMKGQRRNKIHKLTGIPKSSQIRIEKGISYRDDTIRLGLLK